MRKGITELRIVLVVPLALLSVVAGWAESFYLLTLTCAATAFFLGCSIESAFRVKPPLKVESVLTMATVPLLTALGVGHVIAFAPWMKTMAVVSVVALLTGAALARWKHKVDDSPGGPSGFPIVGIGH